MAAPRVCSVCIGRSAMSRRPSLPRKLSWAVTSVSAPCGHGMVGNHLSLTAIPMGWVASCSIEPPSVIGRMSRRHRKVPRGSAFPSREAGPCRRRFQSSSHFLISSTSSMQVGVLDHRRHDARRCLGRLFLGSILGVGTLLKFGSGHAGVLPRLASRPIRRLDRHSPGWLHRSPVSLSVTAKPARWELRPGSGSCQLRLHGGSGHGAMSVIIACVLSVPPRCWLAPVPRPATHVMPCRWSLLLQSLRTVDLDPEREDFQKLAIEADREDISRRSHRREPRPQLKGRAPVRDVPLSRRRGKRCPRAGGNAHGPLVRPAPWPLAVASLIRALTTSAALPRRP